MKILCHLSILVLLLFLGLVSLEAQNSKESQTPEKENSNLETLEDELFTAIWKGDLLQVKTLVTKGASLAAIKGPNSSWSDTPLMEAAKQDSLEIVKFLVDQGADVNARISINAKYGATALMRAARAGHLEIVKFLIEKGADVNGRGVTVEGRTTENILAQAAFEGYTKIVKLLIEKGADINQKNEYGVTALSEAARQGHTEIVKLLIQAGADPNQKYRDVLFQDRTDLMIAAAAGDLEQTRILLEKGEIDLRSPYNSEARKALSIAAGKGHLPIVKLLIEKGFVQQDQTNLKSHALSAAAFDGSLEIVQFLTEHGADSESKGHALVAASGNHQNKKESLEVVKYLLEKGADINFPSYSENTPLTEAVRRGGNLEIINFLLAHGADIHVVDRKGNNVLTYALSGIYFKPEEDRIPIIKLLIQKGVDVNGKNYEGETVLKTALKLSYPPYRSKFAPVIELLKQAGAKENIEIPADIAKPKIDMGKTISGIVKLPDGKPLKGASVAIGTQKNAIIIENGKRVIERGKNALAMTDIDGRFSFPRPTEAYSITVLHEQGFAELNEGEFYDSAIITIQPWGKVEGVLTLDQKPAANQEIHALIHPYQWDSSNGWGSENHRVHKASVTTDENGHFVFERLKPVLVSFYVGNALEDNEFKNRSFLYPIEIKGGQTIHLNLPHQFEHR